jgi:site-specific DNA-cytosine methylase
MDAVELFAGAGGAALGLHAASVEHLRCIEWDKDAAATLARVVVEAVIKADKGQA